MSSINAIGGYRLAGEQAVAARRAADSGIAGSIGIQPSTKVDSVDLSPEARQAGEAARPSEPFRQSKVDQVRAQLSEGTYLNPDKLDIALDRLLKDLNA